VAIRWRGSGAPGFDPYSPSVESEARRGALGRLWPPRRLGPHWRADGAPKAAYLTQGEALSVAEERRHETGVELSVYRCDVCAGWHMGSRDG